MGFAGIEVEGGADNLAFLAVFLLVGGGEGGFDGFDDGGARNAAHFFEFA